MTHPAENDAPRLRLNGYCSECGECDRRGAHAHWCSREPDRDPLVVAKSRAPISAWPAEVKYDPCRKAWADYMAHFRASRKAFAEMPAYVEHGLASTYANWGCRCEPCRLAHYIVSVSRVSAALPEDITSTERYSALWSHFTGRGKPMRKATDEDGYPWEIRKDSRSGNDGKPMRLRVWVGGAP